MVQVCRMLALCLGWMLTFPALSAPPEPLHIGTWDREAKAPILAAAETILRKAYAAIGEPVEFEDLPNRRALMLMLNQHLDGNVIRAADFGNEHPTLYRVETPIYVMEVRAYSTNPAIHPRSWSELNGLRVAYQRGMLAVEQKLPAGAQRMEVAAPAELYRFVKAGIADVAVTIDPADGGPNATATDARVERLDTIFDRTAVHHYLLARHAQIGLRLNGALKKMQASGEMAAITKKAIDAVK